MCVRVCSITQSCPTLCDPLDCSPPGSSVHGIFQVTVLFLKVFPATKPSKPSSPNSPITSVSVSHSHPQTLPRVPPRLPKSLCPEYVHPHPKALSSKGLGCRPAPQLAACGVPITPPASSPCTYCILLKSYVEGQLVSHGAGGGEAAQVLGLEQGVSLLAGIAPSPPAPPPPGCTHHAAVRVPEQDGMAIQECPVSPTLGRLWGHRGHRVRTGPPETSGLPGGEYAPQKTPFSGLDSKKTQLRPETDFLPQLPCFPREAASGL